MAMEPLSIATGCISLLTGVSKLSIQISAFVASVRDARKDMAAVSGELSSLSLCLETLRDDSMKIGYPDAFRDNLLTVLKNCDTVTAEMTALLNELSSANLLRKIQWTALGRDDMNKLRSSLESHKSALEIGLDMTSLFLISAVKDDVADVKANTAQIPSIKQDTSQIEGLVQQIGFLRLQLNNGPESDVKAQHLQRFLDQSTSYAETVMDSIEDEEPYGYQLEESVSESLDDDQILPTTNTYTIRADHDSPLRATDQLPSRRGMPDQNVDEGMYSDKRYLCYLCNKLFKRRRSVRDHISRLHNIKTWDPIRSLEIIVDPVTGECVEPLEEQIAKGGQVPADVTPPPPVPARPPKVAQVKAEPLLAGSRASPFDESVAPTSSIPTASAPVISTKRPAPSMKEKKGMAKLKSVSAANSTPNKRIRLRESVSASASSESVEAEPTTQNPEIGGEYGQRVQAQITTAAASTGRKRLLLPTRDQEAIHKATVLRNRMTLNEQKKLDKALEIAIRGKKSLADRLKYKSPWYSNDRGSVNEIEGLLDLGADPNYDSYGEDFFTIVMHCPLRYAVLELLLMRGATLELDSAGKWLLTVVTYGRKGKKLANMLLDCGVSPNVTDIHDCSALYDASGWAGDSEMVRLLLDHGAIPDDKSLRRAIDVGRYDIVETLLEHGVFAVTQTGKIYALHQASRRGYSGLVKYLLDHGAIADDKALDGAARSGQNNIVKMMLDHGVSAITKTGKTSAAESAAGNGCFETLKMLLERGALVDDWVVCKAASAGRTDIVKILLDNGASVNAMLYGSTALWEAQCRSRVDVVKLLLERGAVVGQLEWMHRSQVGTRAERDEINLLVLKHYYEQEKMRSKQG